MGKKENYGAAIYGEGAVSVTQDNGISKVINIVTNSFDGFNRLVKTEQISGGKRVVGEYSYDGDDLRVKKTVKASDKKYAHEVTNYIYDRGSVVLETGNNGEAEVRYVREINYIARVDKYDSVSYMLYNGHGDVVQTVSSEGTIDNSYDYDEFGNTTLEQEKYSLDIRYAGYQYDSETGIIICRQDITTHVQQGSYQRTAIWGRRMIR